MFDTVPALGLSPYEMMMLFVIWSFLGWAMEVCVHTLKMGEYSDRGFLAMPLCPIYGFGANIITVLLRDVLDDPLPLFVVSALICTAFELMVGLLLKKVFHNQWWDYSDEPFNFHGYICLKVTLEWGFVCLIGETFIIPPILKAVNLIPHPVGIIFLCIAAVLILIDTAVSFAAAKRLTLHIRQFAELNSKMYDSAEKLGSALGTAALDTSAAVHENMAAAQVQADNLSADIKESVSDAKRLIGMRYDAYMAFTADKAERRLLRAFPHMHPDKEILPESGTDLIAELREMLRGNWINPLMEGIREKLDMNINELIEKK
ncbi:MAG: putative ABC transporter permease [Oscillospiraceae bacterium]|nr:putative ABC transporter permease [Oscillospiraceae bacterium]